MKRRLSLSEPTEHPMEGEGDQEESGAAQAGSSMRVDKHAGGTTQKDILVSASVSP